jgi:hypothetical protein
MCVELIAEKDATLYQALRAYSKPTDLAELKVNSPPPFTNKQSYLNVVLGFVDTQDAVDGCVVDRIDKKWCAPPFSFFMELAA